MEGNVITVALIGNPEKEKNALFRGLIQNPVFPGIHPSFPVPRGTYRYRDEEYLVLNLPENRQEHFTAEFLSSGRADIILVLCSASGLELGLKRLSRLLKLQAIKEEASPVVFCISIGSREGAEEIAVDFDLLEDVLQIPVLPCQVSSATCLDDIKTALSAVWSRMYSYDCLDFSPKKLAAETTEYFPESSAFVQEKADKICFMIFLILFLFWFLLTGAQVPSLCLWRLIYWIKKRIGTIAVHWMIQAIFFCKIML